MGKMDERIMVLDRAHLFMHEELAFQGLLTDEEQVNKIKSRFVAFYEVKRGYAEQDERKKQPIPYVILRRGDEIFLYKRLNAGGEDRLHDSLSIGVGGHMNMLNDNCRWASNFKENLYRELHEELHISHGGTEAEWNVVGLINDDSDANDGVGKYHICILTILDLPEDAVVTVKETDQLEGDWVRTQDLRKTPLFESLEAWSQMAIDAL